MAGERRAYGGIFSAASFAGNCFLISHSADTHCGQANIQMPDSAENRNDALDSTSCKAHLPSLPGKQNICL